MIRPMRAGQTSTIAETDDSAQWPESVLGRIIHLPKTYIICSHPFLHGTGSKITYATPTESAGGVVVTTPASDAGGTGSIPGTGSCDVKIWLSTLGTVYPL